MKHLVTYILEAQNANESFYVKKPTLKKKKPAIRKKTEFERAVQRKKHRQNMKKARNRF